MNQYMLVFQGQQGVDTTEEEFKHRVQLHVNWIEKLGDQHIDSKRLEEIGAHLISHDKVVIDESISEARDPILGYTTIAAKNLDEAIFLAKTCPLLNYYEVIIRPVTR